jgi:hypothetical protein
LEVSIECDSTCGGPEHRELDQFVIHDAKWQLHIQVEVLQGLCIHNLKANAHPALLEDETIAGTHWTLGTFVQLGSRPLRQLARIREQMPYTPHGRLDDFGWAYFHREFSLFPANPQRSMKARETFIARSLHRARVARLAIDAMVSYCVKQSPNS